MKKNTRKGFTITELVIVIVVIAILAAVLIPTFASLVKKANQSADIQAARQMNTALAAASADEDDKPETLQDVIKILADAGYDAEGSLKPITKDHKFYWHSEYNVIVLANEAADAEQPVVYPSNNEELVGSFLADKTAATQVLFDLEVGFRSYVLVDVTDAETAANALNKGQSVTLSADTTATKPIVIPEGAETTLDLGGNTLSTPKDEESGRSDYLNVYGTLVIENGTFNGRGIQVYAGAKLIIAEDADIVVNSVDSNGGAAVWVYAGGEVEINGGTYKATSGDKANDSAGINAEPGVINNSGKVTINGGTFEALETGCYAINNNGGEMVINNGTFTAYRGVIAASAGTVTVNGGTFKTTYSESSGHTVYAGDSGKVIINGGTFEAANGSKFSGNVTGSGKK